MNYTTLHTSINISVGFTIAKHIDDQKSAHIKNIITSRCSHYKLSMLVILKCVIFSIKYAMVHVQFILLFICAEFVRLSTRYTT